MTKSHWQELAGCPVVIQLPVLWGDMDPMGHVNNTRYFRWFESARIAYLDQAIDRSELLPTAVGPILAAVCCNYRRQLIYPDTIDVGARITQLGNSSMTMQHHLVSHAHGKLAAEGESVVVMFDYRAQRPIRISSEVRAAIEQFEGRSWDRS
jgi:acyl-CoA thioester hydrolase